MELFKFKAIVIMAEKVLRATVSYVSLYLSILKYLF